MIKYSFAKYQEKIVHINQVTKQMREADYFYNIVSGKKMTAYLDCATPHFHHIEKENISQETYLHETAKNVFYENYRNCLENNIPFFIEYKVEKCCNTYFDILQENCPIGTENKSFDLTKRYDKIELEKYSEEFKPDLKIFNSEKQEEFIFIEIEVTHKSTQKKINSGVRIIEIKIENENDILNLKENFIKITKKNNFFNFKIKKEIDKYCNQYEKGCVSNTDTFILYKNGTYEFNYSRLMWILADIEPNREQIKTVDFQYRKFNYSNSTIMNEFEYLKEKKIELRLCNLCKYSASNKKKISKRHFEIITFCKFYKEEIENDTKAYRCEIYKKK